mgnify:CR=1 FL=1
MTRLVFSDLLNAKAFKNLVFALLLARSKILILGIICNGMGGLDDDDLILSLLTG